MPGVTTSIALGEKGKLSKYLVVVFPAQQSIDQLSGQSTYKPVLTWLLTHRIHVHIDKEIS